MSDHRIRAVHVSGGRSGRSFTLKELRAAKALGYADNRGGEWSGSVFWATSDIHLDDLRRVRDNINTLLPAWEREWEKWENQ